MKKKLALIALAIALCSILMVFFAMVVSADEGISVTYYNRQKISGATKEVAVPNPDGTYTIKSTGFSTSGTVTLTDGTVDKVFYGWYDDEGIVYTPGEVVKFTKTTRLYEAFGVTVKTFDDLKKAFSAGSYVKLGEDLEGSTAVTCGGRVTSVLDLNGHNLTIDSEEASAWGRVLGAFGTTRGTYCFVGSGTITQLTREKDKNGQFFAQYTTHGSFDEDNPQKMIVGRDVTIITPYVLVNSSNTPKDTQPTIDIAGTVVAKQIFSTVDTSNATCNIYETANITLTGTEAFTFSNIANDTHIYMTVTVRGGTIVMTDPNGVFLTDSLLARSSVYINGGEFTVSAANAEVMKRYIPEGKMLKTVSTDSGVKYVVSDADCTHIWTRDDVNSTNATTTTPGTDKFVCSICSSEKTVINVYNPSKDEIVITVKVGEELEDVTVKLEDFFILEKIGMDEAAYYELVGIKGTEEYPVESIVAIQIPVGIRTIQIATENTTLETINIIDGAIVEIQSIAKLKAVKLINIGAAQVHFLSSSASPVLEKIDSYKAGAKVSFAQAAFSSNKTLKHILMSSGSEYVFGYQAFLNAAITELVIPDNATTSMGEQAFYKCVSLSYVYIGANTISNKAIPKTAFSYCYALETVVLMDIKTINDSAFSVEGDATTTKSYREGKSGLDKPIKILMHTTEAISINAKAFTNRAVLGVDLYMLSSITTELTSCSCTMYVGIAHEYYYDIAKESNCTVPGEATFVTDCPCGIDYRTNPYSIVANGVTTEYEPYGTDIVYLELDPTVHTIGDVLADIIYEDYLANGVKYYFCAWCNEALVAEEEASAMPLFTAVGYSAEEETGSYSVSHTIIVNQKAMSEFSAINNGDVEYGMIGGVYSANPLNENGEAGYSVVKINMTDSDFDKICVKINGVDAGNLDFGFAMCAYVIDGTESTIKYVCGNVTTVEAVSISYNAIVSKEEE